jgi:hypothetical protein
VFTSIEAVHTKQAVKNRTSLLFLMRQETCVWYKLKVRISTPNRFVLLFHTITLDSRKEKVTKDIEDTYRYRIEAEDFKLYSILFTRSRDPGARLID